MTEFNIDPTVVEIEDGDIEITRLSDNLIIRDNKNGITLTVDQDTELSQLWNAFDSSVDTSQFFQEDANGLAELLSGYAGINLAGEDIENADVINANTLNATTATIDGTRSNLVWEQVAYFDKSVSDGSTISLSVADLPADNPILLTIPSFVDTNKVGATVQMELEGLSGGDYEYVERTMDGTFNTATTQNQYDLINTSSGDRAAATWVSFEKSSARLLNLGNVSRYARGGPNAQFLDNITNSKTPAVDPDVTFTVSGASGDPIDLVLAIYKGSSIEQE